MRPAVSAANVALGMLMLAGGNLHAGEDRGEDWPMYGRNLSHTFSNADSEINPSNVSSLQPAWFFGTGDAVSASPTVVDGVVYVGSWDGYFYALDANNKGALIWKYQVDCQNTVLPVPPQCGPPALNQKRFFTDGGLITSSAAVVDGVVYFGAGKTLYSLNAEDGSLRWKQVICGNPDNPDKFACALNASDPTRIFSSPAVFDGLVFVGHTVDGVSGYRGGFEAFDAATGELRWRFEVDPILNSQDRVIGAHNRGCGNVWSSAAVDTKERLVFFGTGDCLDLGTLPYHEAVIALESRTGQPRWIFRPHQADIRPCDFDFGASPNIINLGHKRFLGIGGKDGIYYLLDRLTGEVVWHTNVVFGGFIGGFYGGAAFDGRHIFSATAIGDANPKGLCSLGSDPSDLPLEEPSIHGLNAASGLIFWEGRGNHSFGATSLSDGVVFSGLVGAGPFQQIGLNVPPALKAYNAQTGQVLATFPMPGQVNSAATPVGKMLFVTSGNSYDGLGGGVQAFTLSEEIASKRGEDRGH